jgi:hypothetical protein
MVKWATGLTTWAQKRVRLQHSDSESSSSMPNLAPSLECVIAALSSFVCVAAVTNQCRSADLLLVECLTYITEGQHNRGSSIIKSGHAARPARVQRQRRRGPQPIPRAQTSPPSIISQARCQAPHKPVHLDRVPVSTGIASQQNTTTVSTPCISRARPRASPEVSP